MNGPPDVQIRRNYEETVSPSIRYWPRTVLTTSHLKSSGRTVRVSFATYPMLSSRLGCWHSGFQRAETTHSFQIFALSMPPEQCGAVLTLLWWCTAGNTLERR